MGHAPIARVTICDLDGNIQAQIGGENPVLPGNFIVPHGIWADSRGDFYGGEGVKASGAIDHFAPLTCHAIPPHTTIHHAGGDFTHDPERMDDFFAEAPAGGRPFVEVMHGHNEKVAEAGDRLVRKETGFCEFHLVMARRDVFDAVGGFDTVYRNGFEDVDLCFRVGDAGRRIV